MSRLFWPLFLPALALATCETGGHASPAGPATSKDEHVYKEECIDALRAQVRREFEASLQYLTMSAHFARDDVDLAGFSALFGQHADEERGHAVKLLNYLRMRGDGRADFLGTEDLKPMIGMTSFHVTRCD